MKLIANKGIKNLRKKILRKNGELNVSLHVKQKFYEKRHALIELENYVLCKTQELFCTE